MLSLEKRSEIKSISDVRIFKMSDDMRDSKLIFYRI